MFTLAVLAMVAPMENTVEAHRTYRSFDTASAQREGCVVQHSRAPAGKLMLHPPLIRCYDQVREVRVARPQGPRAAR
ncbi:MAG: hypothetical protein ACOY45_13790 [Pseudomonadota bacterium]